MLLILAIADDNADDNHAIHFVCRLYSAMVRKQVLGTKFVCTPLQQLPLHITILVFVSLA